MLLPQSSAFAALKNRLNSVSAIGYLHIVPRTATTPASSSISFSDRPSRLKSRDDSSIRWTDLLEKFRTTQERARRSQRLSHGDIDGPMGPPPVPEKEIEKRPERVLAAVPARPGSGLSGRSGATQNLPLQGIPPKEKSKSGLGLGRFAQGVGGRKKK